MYSQNNEEQIILDYFKDFTGSFLDIGANDGITFSNTYQLALNGWKGTSIEPSPKAFRRLQEAYETMPDVVPHNLAIASYSGKITLHESGPILQGDTSLVSSIIEEEKARWNNTQFREVEVDCITWEDFYKLSSCKTFDFVSIDIEGAELQVLPQMDFEAMGTRLICVEWNGKNLAQFNNILTGFKIIHSNPENLIYARS